jgi:hypothetical protein
MAYEDDDPDDSGYEDEPRRRREPAGSSGKATASFVVGIFFCLGPLTGIPALILGILSLNDIRNSRGRLRGQGLAVAGIVLGCIGIATTCLTPALLVPAVQKVREAATRVQSANNLKQLALGMQYYQDDNGTLPPAVLRSPSGQPYSWRVALLPYIEGGNLYQQYDMNEPWDGPHNKQLLPLMPRCYASAYQDSRAEPSATYYQVFAGPGAIFEGEKGLSLMDISKADGSGNTLLIVEAAEAVPWTKPQDLPFGPNQPLPRLGHPSAGSITAAFADASVQFIRKDTNENMLRAFITWNGGEPVNRGALLPP